MADFNVRVGSLEDVASFRPAVETDLGFPLKEGAGVSVANEGTMSVKDENGKRKNITQQGTVIYPTLEEMDAEKYPGNDTEIMHVAIKCVQADDKRLINVTRYVQVSNLRKKGAAESEQKVQQMISSASMDDVFEVVEKEVANFGTAASGRKWYAYNLVDAKKVS